MPVGLNAAMTTARAEAMAATSVARDFILADVSQVMSMMIVITHTRQGEEKT